MAPRASRCLGCKGRQRGNLFFPRGTVSLVPLCPNFSQWARFWQAGVKLPILSGDALFTAAHTSSQAGLAGPPLQGTLRLPQVKNPLLLRTPLSSEVLRRCKTSLWDPAKSKQKLPVQRWKLLWHPCFTASSGGRGGDPQATPPVRVEHVPILSQFPAPAVSTALATSPPTC